MTSLEFWPAMAPSGLLLTQHLQHADALVEGKHEDKAINFLLLVLCDSKSREVTSNRDRERGPRSSPGAHRQRSSLQAHGGNFIWHVWFSAVVF